MTPVQAGTASCSLGVPTVCAREDECDCRRQVVQSLGGWVWLSFQKQQKGWTIIKPLLKRSCVALEGRKVDPGTGGLGKTRVGRRRRRYLAGTPALEESLSSQGQKHRAPLE